MFQSFNVSKLGASESRPFFLGGELVIPKRQQPVRNLLLVASTGRTAKQQIPRCARNDKPERIVLSCESLVPSP